ncbi:MAG: hypothetical protein J7604_22470 [Sporocytophaga sp.]|uniref:hypothetical protein n=1 Tax=Sporocytophaga sp. TaxID=2231183 RepID=UPI001B1144AD|nr:hypothetical protein [Sporocytophaga sp.]MBO9702997.1 hypothetical protein [Sporocytophaga sp.]
MKKISSSILLFILIMFASESFSIAGENPFKGHHENWLKRYKTRKINNLRFSLDSIKTAYPQPFLTIHLGASYTLNTGNVQVNSGQTPGTKINVHDDLGFPKHPILLRANVIFSFGNFHWISFDTYNVNRRGTEILDKDIKYGDTTFLAGNQVKSQLKLNYLNLSYINFFYDDGRSRAAFLLGVTATIYSLRLSNRTFPDFNEKHTVFVPLPTIGFNASTYLNKRLLVLAVIKYGGWWSKNYNCNSLNINPYFEYYLYKNFGIGMRYNYGFTSFKKLPEKKFNGNLKDNFNAISVVLVYRFLKKGDKKTMQ